MSSQKQVWPPRSTLPSQLLPPMRQTPLGLWAGMNHAAGGADTGCWAPFLYAVVIARWSNLASWDLGVGIMFGAAVPSAVTVLLMEGRGATAVQLEIALVETSLFVMYVLLIEKVAWTMNTVGWTTRIAVRAR